MTPAPIIDPFPAWKPSHPYAIKTQRKASNTPIGGFGCLDLCLYSIKERYLDGSGCECLTDVCYSVTLVPSTSTAVSPGLTAVNISKPLNQPGQWWIFHISIFDQVTPITMNKRSDIDNVCSLAQTFNSSSQINITSHPSPPTPTTTTTTTTPWVTAGRS